MAVAQLRVGSYPIPLSLPPPALYPPARATGLESAFALIKIECGTLVSSGLAFPNETELTYGFVHMLRRIDEPAHLKPVVVGSDLPWPVSISASVSEPRSRQV